MSFNLSKKETVVLNMLVAQAGREQYGWDMIKQSDGVLKRGTIYITLNRMEDKGFIESRKEARRAGARGQPRRLYKATGLGEKALEFFEMARMQAGAFA